MVSLCRNGNSKTPVLSIFTRALLIELATRPLAQTPLPAGSTQPGVQLSKFFVLSIYFWGVCVCVMYIITIHTYTHTHICFLRWPHVTG